VKELDFDTFAARVADILGAPKDRISRLTTANDVNGWDSLKHANIILTVEDLYGVQFADEDVRELENVGALFDKTVELANS